MDFGYFPHELNSIPVANLALFKSVTTTSGPWARQSPITTGTNVVSKAGITDFSLWTLGNTANPLPVELTSFTATASGAGATVRLTWATASEVNSARFEVERSPDGGAFAAIGQLAAAGTSPTAHAYTLTDTNPPLGASPLYYRLRQVDLDGTTSFSPVRTVELRAKAGAGLALFPNPAHAGSATLTGVEPGTTVTVFDTLGRLVTTAPADASGTVALVLPAGRSAGVYVVRAGTQALRLAVE